MTITEYFTCFSQYFKGPFPFHPLISSLFGRLFASVDVLCYQAQCVFLFLLFGLIKLLIWTLLMFPPLSRVALFLQPVPLVLRASLTPRCSFSATASKGESQEGNLLQTSRRSSPNLSLFFWLCHYCSFFLHIFGP